MTKKKPTFIAYHGDATLKKRFVAEIEKHEEADAIVQGTYGVENGHWKGCAVGCSLRSLAILNGEELKTSYNNHKSYEKLIGVPMVLAKLEDRIFEGLPVAEAKKWPAQFASAIPVGADLSLVWQGLAVWLLVDKEHGVIKFANGRKDIIDAITNVAEAYSEQIDGSTISLSRWQKLRAASSAAAASYADAAAFAAAFAAADTAAFAAAFAADTAASAAAFAADTAAFSAAFDAAFAAAFAAASSVTRQSFYIQISKKLIQLMRESK